jgi:predicted Rossmann-fold nucleotide-binding protein
MERESRGVEGEGASTSGLGSGATGRTPQNLRHAAEELTQRDSPGEAFVAWCEYARHVTLDSPAEVRNGLMKPAHERAADTLLRLRRATLGDADALEGLTPDGSLLRGAQRVTIFAGAAGSMSAATAAELELLLGRALMGYPGAILSGGTGVGVPGVVGRIARAQGLRLVGYVPTGLGDARLYAEIRETPDAHDFSELEPLAMWTDIFRAGIAVDDVRLVVCPGGQITTEEILIARALGARVGWLDPGGEASALLADTLPLGTEDVLELPPDAMSVRAFFSVSTPLTDPLREAVARHLHNYYRRKQRGRKSHGDPALASWDDLLPALRASNYAQADDIPNKLALVHKRVVEHGEPLRLDGEQVELLAEVEHGRWNIERLTAGWQLGERHVGRNTSPDLVPWEALSEDKRDYDREAVRNIAPALEHAGWGVNDL